MTPKELLPHEVRILELLADGCTKRDISFKLLIAEGTAASYMRITRSKLRAKNNANAVAIALRRGIIS